MRQLDTVEILIIGGGSSGMMAALSAAESGRRILLVERMGRIGKKLLVTGNSRCNLTNLSMHPRHYHGAGAAFVETVLSRCSVKDTLALFQELGLAWKADDENRVYPVSEQASSVLDLLRFHLVHKNVEIRTGSPVVSLSHQDHFIAHLKNHQTIGAERVILAAGGQAMKDLGSNGSGYPLASGFGHHVIEPFPALVKITLDTPLLRGLKGERHGACLFLTTDQQKIAECCGEIQFTENGVSGIPAMQISRHVHSLLKEGNRLRIEIDLFPDYSADTLLTELANRFRQLNYLDAEQALLSLLKKRLILPVLKTAGIPHRHPAGRISGSQLKNLATVLKHWSFPVTGTRSWNEAQVTAGGIDTLEIDPETLRSKKVSGLYFAGEIMDVDGECGGYNLQWAWSTGRIAGLAAAASLHS